MNTALKLSIVIFGLLSLTEFSIAELQTETEINNSKSEPKVLKVEEGSIKVGENSAEPKTRALALEYSDSKEDSQTNMNIGKVEFYVK
jgi:hypothetical protein